LFRLKTENSFEINSLSGLPIGNSNALENKMFHLFSKLFSKKRKKKNLVLQETDESKTFGI
jgi:hypothetical protein